MCALCAHFVRTYALLAGTLCAQGVHKSAQGPHKVRTSAHKVRTRCAQERTRAHKTHTRAHKESLRAYEEDIGKFVAEKGGQLIGVTSQTQTEAMQAQKAWGLSFPLVGDPQLVLAKELYFFVPLVREGGGSGV